MTLHIRTEDLERIKRIFDELKEQQKQIEKCIEGEDWCWHKWGNVSFSSINIRRDGSIDDPPKKLKETKAWMLCTLPKLKQVFDDRVDKILRELPTKADG